MGVSYAQQDIQWRTILYISNSECRLERVQQHATPLNNAANPWAHVPFFDDHAAADAQGQVREVSS